MKKEFNCFEVTQLLIDEATKQFSPLWVVDDERYHTLYKLCESLNLHFKKWDVETYEVTIDDITMEIIIILECKNKISYSLDIMLYFASDHNAKCTSRINENDLYELKFTFSNIWKRNSEKERLA